MGYRSEVAIAMYESDFDDLVERASESDSGASDLINCATLYKKGRIITITWDNIKWYENYEDVEFIMSFLRENAEKYQIKRIGEDIDDIEEELNDDEYELDVISIERYIDMNYAGDELDTQSIVTEILRKRTESKAADDKDFGEVSENDLFNIIENK